MPKGMQAIYTQTASGSANIITFNSIPQIYTDLHIKIHTRDAQPSQATNRVRMYFNGDVGSRYSCRALGGNAGSAFSFNETNSTNIPVGLSSSSSSNTSTMGQTEVYIPNYALTAFKQVMAESVAENNSTSASSEYLNMACGLYRSNAPITSVTLIPESGPNFTNLSTFTLYGISR